MRALRIETFANIVSLMPAKPALALKADPYESFVESLAEAMDLRERETGLHSKRVAAHTLLLAQHFYNDAKDLQEIYWGSLLHDIGKIGVPDSILLKPGGLSADEWEIMCSIWATDTKFCRVFLTWRWPAILCFATK